MTIGRIPSVEGGIQPTIFDAKADILTATAADTPARLAVGANDTVLTADSTTATGLKWATPSSGGITLLSTTSLSGASVTVSSISQDYTHLYCEIYGMTNATANGNFKIEPNAVSSNYMAALNKTTAYYSSDIRTDGNLIDRTNSGNAFSLIVYNYTSSHFKTFQFFGFANGDTAVNGAGSTTDNTAISSMRFSNSGGNFSAGTVKIYGVK